jgi:hypothetical protein
MWLKFKEKLPAVSLILAFVEVTFIWGLFVLDHTSPPLSPLTVRLAAAIWIFGGLGSIVCAICAMTVKPRPRLAPVALAVAIVAYLICGLPMLV